MLIQHALELILMPFGPNQTLVSPTAKSPFVGMTNISAK